jgi:hypothetical protein
MSFGLTQGISKVQGGKRFLHLKKNHFIDPQSHE